MTNHVVAFSPLLKVFCLLDNDTSQITFLRWLYKIQIDENCLNNNLLKPAIYKIIIKIITYNGLHIQIGFQRNIRVNCEDHQSMSCLFIVKSKPTGLASLTAVQLHFNARSLRPRLPDRHNGHRGAPNLLTRKICERQLKGCEKQVTYPSYKDGCIQVPTKLMFFNDFH